PLRIGALVPVVRARRRDPGRRIGVWIRIGRRVVGVPVGRIPVRKRRRAPYPAETPAVPTTVMPVAGTPIAVTPIAAVPMVAAAGMAVPDVIAATAAVVVLGQRGRRDEQRGDPDRSANNAEHDL